MEKMAVEKEEDDASRERLTRIEEEIADKQEQLRTLETRWEAEKTNLNRVGDLKKQIDELRSEAEKAQREGDLGRASEILYGKLPALQKQVDKADEEEAARKPMVSEEVSGEDIAEVVSAWTGVPVGRMLEGESQKLLHMEERLGERLIGQTKAVQAVSDAVRRSRAGISDPNRPTGSFLFLSLIHI